MILFDHFVLDIVISTMSSPTSSADDNQQAKTNTYRKSDSNESGGSGGSNHSMLSIGNTSFGFNFDSDPPMMHLGGSSSGVPSEKTSEGDNSDNGEKQERTSNSTDADAAADANVANLQSLARSQVPQQGMNNNESLRKRNEPDRSGQREQSQQVQYHQYDQQNQNDESIASQDDDDDDDDDQSRSTAEPRSANGSPLPKRRKKRLNEMKRVERNAREKERSFRISKQINELRGLLSNGGVIVPKGTKSSVLTEAAGYIRMLQQHQYRSEM